MNRTAQRMPFVARLALATVGLLAALAWTAHPVLHVHPPFGEHGLRHGHGHGHERDARGSSDCCHHQDAPAESGSPTPDNEEAPHFCLLCLLGSGIEPSLASDAGLAGLDAPPPFRLTLAQAIVALRLEFVAGPFRRGPPVSPLSIA
jgi:hypothetical protein